MRAGRIATWRYPEKVTLADGFGAFSVSKAALELGLAGIMGLHPPWAFVRTEIHHQQDRKADAPEGTAAAARVDD